MEEMHGFTLEHFRFGILFVDVDLLAYDLPIWMNMFYQQRLGRNQQIDVK